MAGDNYTMQRVSRHKQLERRLRIFPVTFFCSCKNTCSVRNNPIYIGLGDSTLQTPKTPKEVQTLQTQYNTSWTTCASVDLELETGMALQIWMCLAHVRRQYRKIAGIGGVQSLTHPS